MSLPGRLPAFAWGIVGFAVSLAIYSLIVVFTTPNLAPITSLAVSLRMNPHIMIGIPLGVGVQTYLLAYVKRASCPVRGKASAFGGTATGSALSAFFSFFGLTQIGCCTMWLYYLSLLPSVIGGGAAAILIRYSVLLSNLSLALVWIPVVLFLLRIRNLETRGSHAQSAANQTNLTQNRSNQSI